MWSDSCIYRTVHLDVFLLQTRMQRPSQALWKHAWCMVPWWPDVQILCFANQIRCLLQLHHANIATASSKRAIPGPLVSSIYIYIIIFSYMIYYILYNLIKTYYLPDLVDLKPFCCPVTCHIPRPACHNPCSCLLHRITGCHVIAARGIPGVLFGCQIVFHARNRTLFDQNTLRRSSKPTNEQVELDSTRWTRCTRWNET